MSEQNCVLACGLGQGRLRAAIGRSFTTVRLAVPEISCSLPLREISTDARFTPCLLPPPAADVCQTVIYINFVLRHPRYRLAAALRCPKFLCLLPLREISTAARFTPCLLPPPAADVCQTVIYINFVLRHPMYRLAAALRCPKFLCSLPLREISTAARFTPCLLPPQAAAGRETPFESPSYQKRKALLRSAFLFWQPNRDSNPNIQSQSLLCYRYTIRLYLLLAENSISVCSPVVNSFLQFSKNYA